MWKREAIAMNAIKAHYDGKYLVPDEPVTLPTGKALRIQVEIVDALASESLYKLADLAVPTGIPDLAMNIDHYLYGHSKVKNAD